MQEALVLLLALVIDITWGELPSALHPVVGMGKLTSCLERLAPRQRPLAQLIYGGGVVLVGVTLFALPAYFLLLYLRETSSIAYVIVAALLLKSAFSVGELNKVAFKIKGRLMGDDLGEARGQMRSLVSRDARGLSKPLMVSATVESVAENTCDSFIAPLFFFLLFGVPGAIAYRVSNTLDAMIGYHGKYEYLGKFAARLDDGLNFLPARITGLMMVVAAFLAGKEPATAWRTMLCDHGKTRSPNAGWPMASAAGALGVQLEKVGHYRLGNAKYPLLPETIGSSLKLMRTTVMLWVLICILVEVMKFVLTS